MKTSILLFGQCGSGKSTIGNKILQDSAFKISTGQEQQTLSCQYGSNAEYEVTDLVGTAEPVFGRIPHKKAIKWIHIYLLKNTSYNYICYVTENIYTEDYNTWKYFLKLFSNYKQHIIIIFSKRLAWLKNNKTKIYKLYPEMEDMGMIEVDFEKDDKKSMENLMKITKSYVPRIQIDVKDN